MDLNQFLASLRRIRWQAFLLCLLSVFAGFIFSHVTYVPDYTSHTTFVVRNKTVGVTNDSESMTISDLNASSALANTFKYILLSDEAMNAVISTYGLPMSASSLKNCVNISPVPNTNILEMSVTTHDGVLSRNIANKIIEYYPEVLERTIKYASLEVLNPPQAAQVADRYYGNLVYPALGLFSAVFLSSVYVYLKQILCDTVRTASDIHGKLGRSLLASIPRVRSPIRLRKRKRKWLYATDKSNGFTFMESYKALRTKIELLAEKKGYKSFVVTSALEGEGKTTVAVNLSITLAENGKKVLLLDADLRNPSVFRFLGLTSGTTDPEAERMPWDSIIKGAAVVKIKELGFSALINANEFTDSSELLSSAAMKNLIRVVSDRYDFVIIDSPPASVLTDSAVITAYTDAVILTVRQDYAAVRLVESVAASLSENQAEFIGCVFNAADEQGFGYGKYLHYSKYGQYGKREETSRLLDLAKTVIRKPPS